MKEILLSRFTQFVVRGLMAAFMFLAGTFGMNLPTAEMTGSAELVASIIAAGVMWFLDTYIHRKRDDAPAAVPYHESPLIAFLLLPGLLLMSGCGKDERVHAAHEFTKRALENSKKNHSELHKKERAAYEREAKEHIDTKFRWDAEKIVVQAKANPAITAQQIVDEMLFKTFQRDKARNFVELQVTRAAAAQEIADKDLTAALRINGQLQEYAAQPGFDFIALIQGLFGSPKETEAQKLPDAPLESLPAEIISLPAAPPAQ